MLLNAKKYFEQFVLAVAKVAIAITNDRVQIVIYAGVSPLSYTQSLTA